MAKRNRRPIIQNRARVSKPRKERRLVIPQTPDRPLQIHARDLVKREELRVEIPGFVVHRRGVRRVDLGGDPLEAYAIPYAQVVGTLPERIVYKVMVITFHMVAGSDFTFQSSLQGGRLELGGIVADFLLPNHHLCIQVQGSSHATYLRHLKDEEQAGALAEMGYRTIFLEEKLIYNQPELELTMKQLLNLTPLTGGENSQFSSGPDDWSKILDRVNEVGQIVEEIYP